MTGVFGSTLILVIAFCITSCSDNKKKSYIPQDQVNSLVGTWKLISGTTIKDQDTTVTDYTKDQEMIKIINETHFAFLRHDLTKGMDSTAIYVAGGGEYSVEGNTYTEHLQYLNIREWEGNSFEFEFAIDGDTLITQGVEKVEDLGVEYYNIERYHRVKK